MEKKQSGLGVASMILGIVSIPFSFIVLGIVPAVIGLILGIIALANNKVKKGMAIAGVICSGIGILIFSLFLVLIGSPENEDSNESYKNENAIVQQEEQSEDNHESNVQDEDKTEIEDEEETDNIFIVGECLETDDLKISYLSCKQYESDNRFIQPKDGYVYYRLEFEFDNIGDSDHFVSSWDFEGYADSYSVEQTYFDDNLSATISPGKKAKGAVYFEVPTSATEITAEYELDYWTEEKVVFIIK